MTVKTALLSMALVAALAAPTFRLVIRLGTGERLVERRYENDAIEWRLPRKLSLIHI